MDWLSILAQAQPTQAEPGFTMPQIVTLEDVWAQITSLDLVEALTFISFGAVCLLYGWRVFKVLVTICFGLIGLVLSVWVNKELVGGNVTWLAIIMVTLFAVLSIPLMRWAVSILGALSGCILAAAAWLGFGLPQQYIWAGALVGLIAGGMISFIIFKIAVILFTSLGGSVLVAMGSLAIIYDYMANQEQLHHYVFDYRWFLPLVVGAPMVVAFVLQHRMIKGTQDWTV